MKKSIFTFCILLISITISAQNATIKGTLKDSKTLEPLIGVNISIDSLNGTTTDIEGKYEIIVDPTKYNKTKIKFSYIGYEDIIKDITLKADKTEILDIMMGETQSLLDEVVVTSSKFERKIGEESVSIDIIKPAALEKQNLNNVSEVLQRSSGVTVVDGQANIRGGSGYSYGAGSRVLLLLDDLPILQADAGFPSWSGLPVENIGQIEVIKGAASALYGTSAMNGIVNVRTAYPTSKPYAKISIFGSVSDNPNPNDYLTDSLGNIIGNTKTNKQWWKQDSITLPGRNINEVGINIRDTTIKNEYTRRPYDAGFSFAYREKIGKLDVVAGGMFYKKQGHTWGSNETRGRMTINLRYRINDKMSFGVNTNIQMNKSQTFFLWGGNGVDKYIPSAATGIPTESRTFRISVDPFFRYADLKGNSHKVLIRYNRTAVDNSNDQDNSNNFYYGEYQYQRKIDKWNFVVTTGAVGSYFNSKAQLFGDTTHTGTNIAGYFQLDKKFFKRLNISYGFRFETNRIDKDKWETKPVSRVGLNVQAAKYTFIRSSFGQGYRYPTVAERFIETSLSSSFGIFPNRNLTSETGLSVELGIKQGIKLGKHVKAFADLAAFYTEYKNMIEFNLAIENSNLGFKARNIPTKTRIFGIEASVGGEGKLFGKFPTTLNLGYTYIIPQYADFENYDKSLDIAQYNILKYRIRHQFVGVWDIDFKGFTFGLTGQFYSFMENADGIFDIILPSYKSFRASRLKKGSSLSDEKPKFKGDFILDTRIGYHFKRENRDFNFSFLIKNITNREYTLRPTLVEPPRTYGFRMDMTFN
ncbi:MAG TPA: TonB-dependent receptor [Chitinophagales bacterium]|nr:TonB-dependent receptor [Chitinophagales bacterium]